MVLLFRRVAGLSRDTILTLMFTVLCASIVYLGPWVKCRRIVKPADRSSLLSLAESALVRGIPFSNTNSGNTRHIIGIRRLDHTHNFAFPPTHPEEGPAGRRRRARPAPSVTLSSLPGQPDITPIFPHFSPVLVR